MKLATLDIPIKEVIEFNTYRLRLTNINELIINFFKKVLANINKYDINN